MTVQNGANVQGTALYAEPDTNFQYVVQPMKLAVGADSSLIGAPSGGSGLRLWVQIYFGITPTPFRVRWTAPEVRKVV